MSDTPYLSVIIPAYNEAKNFNRGALDEVTQYLKKQSFSWEVILSDDGSSDNTVELLQAFAAKHPGVRLIENPHQGKGPTVSAGMLAAKGKYRLFTDFDQSTPLEEFEKFEPFMADGYDVVIGSRAVQGARRSDEPLHRHIMGKGFNLLVQFIAVSGIHDTQCGFKLFSGKATEDLFPRLRVYGARKRQDAFTGAFDVELLLLARHFNYTIAEVPVEWNHHETDRVSPVKDSLRMLADTLRIRWNAIQGRY
jgi:dolichyl-phosphate beta-glucosyltransferase